MIRLRSHFLWGIVLGFLAVTGRYASTVPTADSRFDGFGSYAQAVDTVTYSDQRIVYTVDVDTATNAAGQLRYILDLTAAPAGARMLYLMKSDFDSAMIVTGDTFALSPTDSATALARATSWGVKDPFILELSWHVSDPLSVTNMTLAMVFDTLQAGWTESADDYQVRGGLETGPSEDYTDTVAGPPNKQQVATFGSYWSCIRTLRSGALGEASCLGTVYTDTGTPPTPGGLTDTTGAIYVYDYDLYANTTEYRDATTFFNSSTGNVALDLQFIDTTNAFPGLTNSVRYDWTYAETCELGNGPAFTGCDSRTIGRAREIPNFGTEKHRELWAEVVVRYGPNFTACSAWDDPCDHKTIFMMVWPDENGRWEWHMTGGGGAAWTADRSYGIVTCSARGIITDNPGEVKWCNSDFGPGRHSWFTPAVDTTWHVWRLYIKHSTTQGSDTLTNSMDARIAVWDNDVLVYDTKAWQDEGGQTVTFGTYNTKGGSGDTYVRALILGVNKDKGAGNAASGSFPRTESMYFGRAVMWDFNPGWLMWPNDTPSVGTF